MAARLENGDEGDPVGGHAVSSHVVESVKSFVVETVHPKTGDHRVPGDQISLRHSVEHQPTTSQAPALAYMLSSPLLTGMF